MERLFCLNFSFIGWSFLCLFTCGIGYLWLSPYMEASYAEFYREIKREKYGEAALTYEDMMADRFREPVYREDDAAYRTEDGTNSAGNGTDGGAGNTDGDKAR